MPLYHFHVSDDGRPDYDTQGTEFPSAAAASADALRYAGGVIQDRAGRTDPVGTWRVDVVDDAGAILFRIDVAAMRSPTMRADRRQD